MTNPVDGCVFCTKPEEPEMCPRCSRSYDRSRRTDDGTLHAMMVWAARRARRFALKEKG